MDGGGGGGALQRSVSLKKKIPDCGQTFQTLLGRGSLGGGEGALKSADG